MSDIKTPDLRDAYHVVFTYDVPMPTTLTVAARSHDHAKELALSELKNHRNVEVIDVYRLKDAQDIQKMMEESAEIIDFKNKNDKVVN